MPSLDLVRAAEIGRRGRLLATVAHMGREVWAAYRGPEIRVSGGVISAFSRGGVDYTQVRFDASGGFSVSDAIMGARYALIGGGGGGGRAGGANPAPGGGGGGGFKDVSRTILPGSYAVTVGAGSVNGNPATNLEGSSGGPSSLAGPFSDSVPGGGGGGGVTAGRESGLSGGGGGGGGSRVGFAGSGGAGLHGFPGGVASPGSGAGSTLAGGGGGGAGTPGGNAESSQGGRGGDGVYLEWVAAPLWVAGGGGGRSAAMGANGLGGGSAALGGGTQSASSGVAVDPGGPGAVFLVFPSAAAVAVYA